MQRWYRRCKTGFLFHFTYAVFACPILERIVETNKVTLRKDSNPSPSAEFEWIWLLEHVAQWFASRFQSQNSGDGAHECIGDLALHWGVYRKSVGTPRLVSCFMCNCVCAFSPPECCFSRVNSLQCRQWLLDCLGLPEFMALCWVCGSITIIIIIIASYSV